MEDTFFMDEALLLAQEAFADGEVPVGCVITRGDEIVGRGRNRREGDKSALAHAEIEAISEACRNLGGWRLWECTLYVTLEPCPMCAGAILNARIPRVVYGLCPVRYEFQPPPGGGMRCSGSRMRRIAHRIFPKAPGRAADKTQVETEVSEE